MIKKAIILTALLGMSTGAMANDLEISAEKKQLLNEIFNEKISNCIVKQVKVLQDNPSRVKMLENAFARAFSDLNGGEEASEPLTSRELSESVISPCLGAARPRI